MGGDQSARRGEGRAHRHHQRPVSGDGVPRTQTREKTASNPRGHREDAEVEHLHCRRGEDGAGLPAGAPVGALGVALHEIVVLVGAGDVPEPPLAVGVNQVWLVDAAVFPHVDRDERRLGLIDPAVAVPFEITDRVRSPEMLGRARVIDALDVTSRVRVPSGDVRRAMTSAVQVPTAAALLRKDGDSLGIAGIGRQHPALRRERRAVGQRGGRELDAGPMRHLGGDAHPPTVLSPEHGRVGDFDRIDQRREAARRIEHTGVAHAVRRSAASRRRPRSGDAACCRRGSSRRSRRHRR